MDTEDIFLKANSAYDAEEYELAFKLFQEGANNNDSNSMSRLASMYSEGEGTKRNYEKSIEWDLRAIEAGNVESLGNLAITYRMLGDIKSSKHWFEKAIEAGDGDAAFELAKLYMVSDKENEKIISLLLMAIHSKNVCEDTCDEAQSLMSDYTNI